MQMINYMKQYIIHIIWNGIIYYMDTSYMKRMYVYNPLFKEKGG